MADEKIVFYYKPLSGGTHHKYVLYLDANGNVKGWARLGSSAYETASAPGIDKASPASPDYPFGKLYGVHGDASTWNETANPDWDSTFEPGGASSRGSSTAAEAPSLQDEWDQLTNNIDALDAAEYPYDPATTNCNSGMDTAAAGVDTAAYPDGLDLPENDDLGEFWSPGSGITVSGPGGGYIQKLVAAYLDWAFGRFLEGESEASPLVLDLDDSGTIELISLASSETYWDNDVNGFRSVSGWVTGGDGLLALDVNDNGRIDHNGELFGTADTDGFTVLATYDSNDDGLITQEDSVWDDLIIWVDDNEDGYSESAELYSMADLDIISIDLNATPVSTTNQGHSVTHTSTFTVDTGGGTDTRIVHDVWFQYDAVNTFYIQDALLDEAISLLPSVRGYGVLADLHFVVSSDDSGTGNLRERVIDFVTASIDELFVDDSSVFDDVRDIMFRWAGVDGVASDSRGDYIDARELQFLEAMMGQPFLQGGWISNPGYWAAEDLKEAFYTVQQNIFARLAAQSAGGSLFTGDFHYDIAADEFVGITGLDTAVLDDLEILAGMQSSKDVFWQNVVRMIEFAVGVDNLSGGDETALDDAIYDSDNSLSLAQIVDSLDYSAPTGTTYNGTSGNDPLTGGTGADLLLGDAGDDTMNGGLGADELRGQGDDDIMNGQSGADILRGGLGDDTYIYEAGHGDDVFIEEGTGAGNDNDEIKFGTGIDAGDLTITRVSNTDMLIEIDNGVVTGSIVIQNQFSNGIGHIEGIEFIDTSTYDLDAQSYTLTGTSGNDSLYGAHANVSSGSDTIYGGAGNDTIYGYAAGESDSQANTLYGEGGNDLIYGGSGADTIYGGDDDDTIIGNSGNDDMSGGVGDDSLNGAIGDDTYRYVSGADVYSENTGTDVLRLDAAWNSITPQYFRIANDLQIYFSATDNITITSFFSGGSNQIESMVYADTTTVNLTTVSATTQGTSGNDNLGGTSGADVLYGMGGDDYLQYGGTNGNDALYGGTGDDYLYGGYGNDYLDGGAGNDNLIGGGDDDHYFYASGTDVVTDFAGTEILELVEGWTWADVVFERRVADLTDLVITLGGSNTITLTDMFYSTSQIETLRLNDGTGDVNLLNLHYTTHGNSSNNSITGINHGSFSSGVMNDTIYGYGGNDTLDGGDGNDTLDGGTGDDTLTGGAGNDTFFYANGYGHDVINEGTSGTDILELDAAIEWGSFTIRRNVADLYDLVIGIDGSNSITLNSYFLGSGYAIETLRLNDGTGDITLTSSQIETHGNSSGNYLTGITANASTNDIFYGWEGNDSIYGYAGNDTYYGGAGNDAMQDDSGSDIYVYESGLDTVYDYLGTDTLRLTGSTTINDITISDLGSHHKIVVNASTDEITLEWVDYASDYQVENIEFADGFKTTLHNWVSSWIMGTSGNDTSTGNGNANTQIGYAGNDTMDGLGGNDAIHGGSGDDSIEGGDGADLLHGGVDDDTLYGEDGLDTLYGGAGADIFVLQSASAFNNVDTVKDFSTAQGDALDIADILSGYDQGVDELGDFVTLTNDSGNTQVFVDRDGTGGTYSSVQVALLEGITGLNAETLETNGNLITV